MLCWKVHCCWSAVVSKMTKKVNDAAAIKSRALSPDPFAANAADDGHAMSSSSR